MKPFQTVAEARHVEVDEECDLQIDEAEITGGLRDVDGKELIDRLQLDEDATFDDEIGAVAAVEVDALVEEWHGTLPLEPHTS